MTSRSAYKPRPVDLPGLRRERVARLRQVLQQMDCAAGLFFDPVNIRYTTDVSNMQVWCLHNPTRYAFVATDGPVIQFEFASCDHLVKNNEVVDEVRPARPWTYLMAGPEGTSQISAWASEIADLVKNYGGGNHRLAIDRVDWKGYAALQCLGVQVVDGQPLVERARSIKTPQEITAIRDAISACETAVREMRARLVPGATEQEVWSVLHQQNIALGGEWIETRLLASGPRTKPWYQECSDRVIEQGDLVALDTDLIGRHGYCCDISRTWRAGDGRPVSGQQRAYAGAFEHLQRILQYLRPGQSLGELSEAVGPPPACHHVYTCLIHGIGMCDEYPVAHWQTTPHAYDAMIEPGMTLCVESYLGPWDCREGVKLEEQVLVTDHGVEVLSTLPFEESWL